MRVDPVTGDRATTGCRDLEAAKLFRAERERQAADPAYAAAQKATVGKWAGELLATKATSVAAGTLDMYRTKLGHIVRVFGPETPMASVGPVSVDTYVKIRREEEASDHTIAKELIALRGLCALAKRAGEWSGDLDTLQPVGFSSGYAPRKTALTNEQALALTAQLSPERAVAVWLALLTGARRSELPCIWEKDVIRYASGSITIHIRGTKTDGADRVVPIVTSWQRTLFNKVREALPIRPWSNMNRDLALASVAAELPFVVTPNDLRRTFASWLIEAGVTREEVAKMLGHSGTAMVFRVYGRADPEKEGESIRRRLAAGHALEEQIDWKATHGQACTDPSHSQACMVTHGNVSCRNYGVSDGDRTRDNRSHNPVRPTQRPRKP